MPHSKLALADASQQTRTCTRTHTHRGHLFHQAAERLESGVCDVALGKPQMREVPARLQALHQALAAAVLHRCTMHLKHDDFTGVCCARSADTMPSLPRRWRPQPCGGTAMYQTNLWGHRHAPAGAPPCTCRAPPCTCGSTAMHQTKAPVGTLRAMEVVRCIQSRCQVSHHQTLEPAIGLRH